MDATEAALNVIRSWNLPEVARFAVERRGFGNSDGGFGIISPHELDENDKAQGSSIPDGQVEIYCFWGPPDGYEFQISEAVYLEILVKELEDKGLDQSARKVKEFRRKMDS